MIGEIHLKKLLKPEATTPFSKILCICALLSPWRHNGLDHRVSQIWRVDPSLLGSCQLTTFKTRYPLTSIMWPYRGLKLKNHRGQVFFLSWPLTKCWFFSIGLRAHVWLTCWKQGRIVRKPVNANPGSTFSSIQMFLLLCFVYIVIVSICNRMGPRAIKD